MTKFIAVIMAGGKGQRFWPLSTEDKPKQFLDLERCGRSLLQSTYDRLLPLTGGANNVFIATGQQYVNLIKEQLPEIPEENLIIEPVGRDSAPAVAYASLVIQERFGDAIVGVFPSDHRIGKADTFRATLARAINLADKTKGLLTIGIAADRPATGYGYIQAGGEVGEGFHVKKFAEKPNLNKAKSYLASGDFFWNAGIFVWHTDAIISELDTHAPYLTQPLRDAMGATPLTPQTNPSSALTNQANNHQPSNQNAQKPNEARQARDEAINKVFPTLKKISIDFAVMEYTKKAYVIPGDFDWDDIGDWVALERLLSKNNDDTNTVIGRHVGLETHANIIYTENPEDVIVTLGVKDLVVVKRGNTILLMHKDKVQDIKKLLEDSRISELTVL
ncbi:MAG: mannose-1-phosphate guanylyltransferase [Trueperaceae bacterium]|nr:mannose-1-phosphate guanylyltransferase [Trueperaceae bacterium]